MLNIDLIYRHYDSLTKDKKEELLIKLFKNSRQTMAYFRRTKNVSLSKLEILADAFNKPIDYFRLNNPYDEDEILKEDVQEDTKPVEVLESNNEELRKELKKLQEKNDTLTEMLRLKTETCEALQLSKHCLELLVAKNICVDYATKEYTTHAIKNLDVRINEKE